MGAMNVEQLIKLDHNPKVLELEDFRDGQFRLVLTLSKLGQVVMLDFVLDGDEAREMATALIK